MRVLVACEFSGIVREAFRLRGHDAYSCDLLPALDGSPFHIVGDAEWFAENDKPWDLLIAHPPCTYLAVSGAVRLHAVIRAGSSRVRGESHWLSLVLHPQARTDCSAVDVRAWRDKGNLPLAQQPTQAHADECSRRARATYSPRVTERTQRPYTPATAQHNLSGTRRCYGRAVGKLATVDDGRGVPNQVVSYRVRRHPGTSERIAMTVKVHRLNGDTQTFESIESLTLHDGRFDQSAAVRPTITQWTRYQEEGRGSHEHVNIDPARARVTDVDIMDGELHVYVRDVTE